MPAVPKRVSELTDEEIEHFGYLGLSETIVFDMLRLSPVSRRQVRGTDRWQNNYKRGLARREMDVADKLAKSSDPATMRELYKNMSISQTKVIDDNAEWVVDAPEWMKPKLNKGKKGQRAKTRNKRNSVQSEVQADVS